VSIPLSRSRGGKAAAGADADSLPNCQGNVINVPWSNANAREFMRDFSRVPPGWIGRIKSVKCFKMNADGGLRG
jgi:hypothetical protein